MLDGQQRLSTICGVLYYSEKSKNDIWNIVFDIENQKFVQIDKTMEAKRVHFPISNILDTTTYLKRFLEMKENCKNLYSGEQIKEFENRITRLLNSFKDYKLPVIEVEGHKTEDVAPIFERINSSGVRLDFGDLIYAKTWSQDFDLNDKIQEIKDIILTKNFDIDNQLIYRNISTALDGGIEKQEVMTKITEKQSDLSGIIQKVKNSYSLAIDFLTMEMPVNSNNQIPYDLQLTLLVEFFNKNQNPNQELRNFLKKFIWHTSISKHFGSANGKSIREDLSNIRQIAISGINSFNFKNVNHDAFLKDSFSLNKASSKSYALLLAHNNPLSLVNGAKIDIGSVLHQMNRHEFHHIFPKQVLKDMRYQDKDINKHLNICILTLSENKTISNKKPSVYIQDLINTNTNYKEILGSNFINEKCIENLLKDDYDNFIKNRSDLLYAKINELVFADNKEIENDVNEVTLDNINEI